MGKEKVASSAGKDSRSVITGDISDIRDSQIAVGDHINQTLNIYQNIKSIPISSDLLALMEVSRNACQEKDIPYRTANLLLLLLQMPNSLTKQSLNRIEDDFGQKLHEALEFYVVNEQPRLEKGNRYIPFDWLERKDIRIAQREALVDKHPVVTQKHLLLGILQSDSKTTKEIREKLGNKFNNLLENIRKEPPSIINNLDTPGNIIQRRNL